MRSAPSPLGRYPAPQAPSVRPEALDENIVYDPEIAALSRVLLNRFLTFESATLKRVLRERIATVFKEDGVLWARVMWDDGASKKDFEVNEALFQNVEATATQIAKENAIQPKKIETAPQSKSDTSGGELEDDEGAHNDHHSPNYLRIDEIKVSLGNKRRRAEQFLHETDASGPLTDYFNLLVRLIDNLGVGDSKERDIILSAYVEAEKNLLSAVKKARKKALISNANLLSRIDKGMSEIVASQGQVEILIRLSEETK